MADFESEPDYRAWSATGWADLGSIWRDLSAAEGSDSTFRGERLNAQQAGWVFERWITEAFRWSEVSGFHRFANPMTGSSRTHEEIDGLVFMGWQGFLIEAKNERNRVSIDPIFRLHLLAEQRPIGTMGLIFSISGYTDPAIESAERLRPIRVLLFDRADLDWAIREGNNLEVLVRRKWILALRTGKPYISVDELNDPFSGI